MASSGNYSEHDMIAVRAGLSVGYPGLSEYSEKIGTFDASKLDATKRIVNHSIRDDLVKSHYLRLNKQTEEKNFSITGNTEQRTRYTHVEPNEYKKITITRKDFKNTHLDNLPQNLGKSEYLERYSYDKSESYKDGKYVINPKFDVVGASHGRPLAKKLEVDVKETSTSQYNDAHDWPKREKRELFEWIR